MIPRSAGRHARIEEKLDEVADVGTIRRKRRKTNGLLEGKPLICWLRGPASSLEVARLMTLEVANA